MADRNMANKARKNRFKGKHRVRSFAVVNTGPMTQEQRETWLNLHAIAQAQEYRADDPTQVVAYRKRARSLARVYKGPVTFNDPRMKALERRREIILQRQPFFSILVRENEVHRLELCYNSQKTCWLFYQELYKEKVVKQSIEYASKERALINLRQRTVRWKVIEPFD
jgi:hypothetical protein